MSKQVINLGASANDGTGDPARSAFTKTNANFSEIYQYLGDGSTLNKLGTAAFKNTGTSAGNVMEVGAFGLSGSTSAVTVAASQLNDSILGAGWYYTTGLGVGNDFGAFVLNLPWGGGTKGGQQLCFSPYGNIMQLRWANSATSGFDSNTRAATILHTANTTVDSNGFIKKASPIVRLFADKIEVSEEASEQEPVFEKVNLGHYLLKNTEGFSDDGWYIEMPKDANGNVLVAVQYQQLEDNTIEVKTFAKKFDEETGDILPNLEKPRDIPVDRWIDIRLKALPQPEIEISNTPDFQPTNLAQAVAEALKNDTEQ